MTTIFVDNDNDKKCLKSLRNTKKNWGNIFEVQVKNIYIFLIKKNISDKSDIFIAVT